MNWLFADLYIAKRRNQKSVTELMTTDRIRILIVDDHKLIRDGISALLEQSEQVEIVGSVSSAEEAINTFAGLKPDIILMDIVMAGISGIEATRWIKEQDPRIKVILISAAVTKDLITAGIQCGIDGYLPKDIDAATLLQAVASVVTGKRFFNAAITQLIFEDFFTNERSALKREEAVMAKKLTTREEEVLKLIASGKGNRQVADELMISVKTVETHKTNILSKLGMKKTVELVHYAIKNSLIDLD